MLESLLGCSLTLLGTLATICTGVATGVGALPILFIRNISDRLLDAMLGFAAGVMLAAAAFGLIVPAIELGGVWITVVGILIGAAFLALLDRLLPHEHFIMGHEGPSSAMRRVWLLIIAITLHNFPEGLAVGVSYGGGDIPTATSLAIAIGLQNMPEGLAVALPLLREKYTRARPWGTRCSPAWPNPSLAYSVCWPCKLPNRCCPWDWPLPPARCST